MAELEAQAASTGLGLPLAVGGATLTALPERPMWSVAPFRGREGAVAAALGTALPAGRVSTLPGSRLIWAGFGVWFVEGPDPGEQLQGSAAVADQSDAWCRLAISGPSAREVLARLVPLDLDPAAFPEGVAARSVLRQVPLLLLVVGDFELFVPRSYARTAVQGLAGVMRRAARQTAIEVTDAGPR